ncbi:homeobox domain-containing protein [Vairimorpha necatrix]|uniref:Homeobox domain-containing protein n=1 Tax=Vairimorpha necatrix TaxID=6039 RepID=A0AAX4J9K5_9MICR
MNNFLNDNTLAEALFGLIKLKKENKRYKPRSYTQVKEYVLFHTYERVQWPSLNLVEDLSGLLDLNINSIKWWFQKKRRNMTPEERKNKNCDDVDRKYLLYLYKWANVLNSEKK